MSLPGYGRGGFIISFTAVCGGCERREPLTGVATIIQATAKLVGLGWGENPQFGLICKGCVRKIGEQMAEEKKLIVPPEEANGNGQ
jgi:hypothetical protein